MSPLRSTTTTSTSKARELLVGLVLVMALVQPACSTEKGNASAFPRTPAATPTFTLAPSSAPTATPSPTEAPAQPSSPLAPAAEVEDQPTATPHPALSKSAAQIVPLSDLRASLVVRWGQALPDRFDLDAALLQVQRLVSAFPGYQYRDIRVEMTDSKTGFSRTSEEVREAGETGDFLFDIVIDARLILDGSEDLSLCHVQVFQCDSYFISLSYSPTGNEYRITDAVMSLQALPAEAKEAAVRIAVATTDYPGNGGSVGWVKMNDGQYWSEGIEEGTVYIHTVEVGESVSELSIKGWQTLYIDVFAAELIRKVDG